MKDKKIIEGYLNHSTLYTQMKVLKTVKINYSMYINCMFSSSVLRKKY